MRKFYAFLLIIFISSIGFGQGIETFQNICTSSCSPPQSAYGLRNWTGDDGSSWTATNSRTSESIVGAAMTMNDDTSNTYIESGTISGGIGDITISTQRKFTGGSGNIDVLINGSSVGTVPYGTSVQTTTISGINISGDIIIRINNNIGGSSGGGADRVAVDDITWTAFGGSTETVDFCNLQFPNSATITEGSTFDAFAQIFESGVTEPGGQGANIEAWIGVSDTNATTVADFTSSDWTWTSMSYFGDSGNNDEYSLAVGSGLTPGNYFYVSRFSVDGGPFAYGGINPGGTGGNFWDGTTAISGVLTVEPQIPTTSASLNITGCGDSDSHSEAYDASSQGIVWVELFYDGNCSEITVDTEGSDFDTEIGLYDSNGNLIASDDDGGTGTLSLITETSLLTGTYYIAAGHFDVDFEPFFNVTTDENLETGTIVINASTPNFVDFCNLQFPGTATITEGSTFDAFAQIFETGNTPGAGAGTNITAEFGISTVDATTVSDFESNDWTWSAASYFGEVGNNDEYTAALGTALTPGTYYYVSRFSVDGGPFAYGGVDPSGTGGNFWDGASAISGVLTVEAQIPTTDATFNINGCGDSDSYNAAYDASTQGIIWVELFYDGNCSEITVDTEGTTFGTEIGLYDSTGTLIGEDDNSGTGNLSSLNLIGLASGTYYIAAGRFNVTFGDFFNVTTSNTSETGTIVINANTPNFVDFCNLQFPSSATITQGSTFDVFAQIFESGVTEASGQGANIEAWIGISDTDATTITDFESVNWTWTPISYFGDVGNNDEYSASVGSSRAIGTHYYVSRFSVDGGPFAYGGINPGSSGGNFWNGTTAVSGVLTVNPKPEPTNHVTSFIAAEDSDTEITLTWDDNDGAQQADGFLIVGRTGATAFFNPIDGTDPADDTDWSDDEFEVKVASGLETYTVTGLSGNTLYDFRIYPFTNSGSNIDFKTDETIPESSANTQAGPVVIAIQDFDSTTPEWTYTTNPEENSASCIANNDVWNVVSSLGNITVPNSTGNFFGSRDLNGTSGCGTSSVGTIDFASVDISPYTDVILTFDYEVDGFNVAADQLSYIVTLDSNPETEVILCTGCDQQDFEGTVSVNIPNGTNTISLQIRAEFDGGSDYFGVDNFMLMGLLISTSSFTYNGAWSPYDPNGLSNSSQNIIIESGQASISEDTSINTVTVEPGASLTIDSAVNLSANAITLLSSSTSYSSLIADNDVGSITYQRHVNTFNSAQGATTGQNDLISAPVTNASQTFGVFRGTNTNIPSGTIGGQPTIFYLFGPFDNNNASSPYTLYSAANDNDILTAGVGYRTASTDTSTFTFVGDIETGTVPVSIDVGSAFQWNLIGNPYPSYINSGAFLTENAAVLDENAVGIYGYDGSAQNGWTIINFNNMNEAANIAPGQGFMVAAESSEIINFTPAMRRSSGADDFIIGRSTETNYRLSLKLDNGGENYHTDFYFNNNSTGALDPGYDAAALNVSQSEFFIYSHLVENNVGRAMAIQSLSLNHLSNVIVPLGVKASQGEEVTFSVNESSLPDTIDIYLEDNENNTFTLLNFNDYIRTLESTLDGTGRFYLHFTDSALSTSQNDLDNLTIFTNESDKTIRIIGQLSEETTARVFDIHGRIVAQQLLRTSEKSHIINAVNLSNGVYVIRLKNKSQVKAQKVIIK